MPRSLETRTHIETKTYIRTYASSPSMELNSTIGKKLYSYKNIRIINDYDKSYTLAKNAKSKSLGHG